MNNEYIETVHKLVDKLCPNKRKPKYDFYNYIENIIYMLTDLNKWSSLRLVHKNKKKYHYKTIYEVFIKWTKLNIFNQAYELLIEKYVLSAMIADFKNYIIIYYIVFETNFMINL